MKIQLLSDLHLEVHPNYRAKPAAGADVLVLGVTTTSAGKVKERELHAIVRSLPKKVELWTGGPGAVRHAAIIGRRGLVLPDYDAYQQELVRIGGRADTFR